MKKFLTALATAGLLVGVLGIPTARPTKAAVFDTMYVSKSGSLNMAAERSCKNADYHNIQTAIDNADDGTTIVVCPGVWRLSDTLYTDNTTGLTLQGFGSKTVLDGTDAGRVISTWGDDAWPNALTLRSLTVQNGHSMGDGVVDVGDFTCDRVTFKNNTAEDGMGYGIGGAVTSYGDATLTNCSFISNKAESIGGAVWVLGSLTDHGSTYKLNVSGSGGALYIDDDDNVGSSIIGSTFTQNRALESIEVGNSFNYDVAEGDGGAVLYNGDDTLTVTNSTFTKNFASNDGGAIVAGDSGDRGAMCDISGWAPWCDEGNGDIVVYSSTFVSNEANSQGNIVGDDDYVSSNDGGAIANEDGDVYAYGNTFQTNKAGGDGGAIYGDNHVEISGNRFIGNRSYRGIGGAAYAGWDFYGDPSANTYRGNTDRNGASTWDWD